MKLDFARAKENIVSKDIIDEIKRYKDVIVFGAGESGDWVINLLRKQEIYPKAICDNYSKKWGGMRNQLMVESFEKTIKLYPDAAICVASVWSEDIIKQIENYDKMLLKRTWDLLSTMVWETSAGLYESKEKEYILSNLAAFEKLYYNLDDRISKKTLEGLLNYRLTRDRSFLKAIKSNEDVYVDKSIISPGLLDKIRNGVLIDGGAFDGDTVDLFIRAWGSRKLDIHCYEPGSEKCKIIDKKKQQWKKHQIIIHNSALWSVSGFDMFFEENGLSGKVEENGKNKIKTETIDSENYKKAGLIKLDIEGAEREALKGGIETIRRCRPILIICAYHLQDDLLVLSDFINSLKCGYSIILRHYMCSSGDTIMYAIPSDS